MPGDPTKTDELDRPKVTAGREKAISMVHNKRTGRSVGRPRARSGVNDFIAKRVTEGINDRVIIPPFGVFMHERFLWERSALVSMELVRYISLI